MLLCSFPQVHCRYILNNLHWVFQEIRQQSKLKDPNLNSSKTESCRKEHLQCRTLGTFAILSVVTRHFQTWGFQIFPGEVLNSNYILLKSQLRSLYASVIPYFFVSVFLVACSQHHFPAYGWGFKNSYWKLERFCAVKDILGCSFLQDFLLLS